MSLAHAHTQTCTTMDAATAPRRSQVIPLMHTWPAPYGSGRSADSPP